MTDRHPSSKVPRAVPFHRPSLAEGELENVRQVLASGHLARDGAFSRRCAEWLVRQTGAAHAMLTHSCTGALELAAILSGVGPGDEVILPSFTFTSTANAFVLRGATPVFVDIRSDTLNLDERLVEAAITSRTRVIVPVHYAGVACEMDALLALAKGRGLFVVEDAAQGILASYKGRALGTLGDAGALSFHETKNVVSGEGGALFVTDALKARAAIVRDVGTNRGAFAAGEVDRYTWLDVGGSFGPGELIAACLLAQLERAEALVASRLRLWQRYMTAFADAEAREWLRRPVVPPGCVHNGHIFYVVLRDALRRDALLARVRARGIGAAFHYVPLHSSPAGQRFGRTAGSLTVTDTASASLVRLPLYSDMEDGLVDDVVTAVTEALGDL